jgi:hypothetical protein
MKSRVILFLVVAVVGLAGLAAYLHAGDSTTLTLVSSPSTASEDFASETLQGWCLECPDCPDCPDCCPDCPYCPDCCASCPLCPANVSVKEGSASCCTQGQCASANVHKGQ